MRRDESPLVTADEVFAINPHIRWVGLVSVNGNVLLNEVRTGFKSASSRESDEEYLKLGPLTLLGVAEQYCPHLKELEAVVACYGLMTHVHARVGSQVIVISTETRERVLSDIRDWLKKKKAILRGW
jgi:hypothetical protein